MKVKAILCNQCSLPDLHVGTCIDMHSIVAETVTKAGAALPTGNSRHGSNKWRQTQVARFRTIPCGFCPRLALCQPMCPQSPHCPLQNRFGPSSAFSSCNCSLQTLQQFLLEVCVGKARLLRQRALLHSPETKHGRELG